METNAQRIVLTALLSIALLPLLAHTASAQLSYPDIQVASSRYDPFPAQPGNYFTIYISLYNGGTADARNVTFELGPSYPFSLDEGSAAVVSYADIAPGAGALIQYQVRVAPDAVEGQNKLFYRYSSQSASTAGSYIPVQVARKNNILIANVTPTRIQPGEETTLTFFLQNRGNSTAQGVTFTWNDPNRLIVPVGSNNQRYLDYLGPSQTQAISFDTVADPSIAPGVYVLNATIAYQGVNATITTSSSVGIIVGGGANLDVTVQSYGQGSASIAIANVGSTPASAVSVSIPPQPGIAVSGANTQFLGNLLKGDFTVATFSINAAGQGGGFGRGGRNGTQPADAAQTPSSPPAQLRVIVSYTDTLGVRQQVEKAVDIDAAQLSPSALQGGGNFRNRSAPIPIYYYGIALAVAAVIAWLAYRRFVKKKPQPAAQAKGHEGK